MIYQRFSDSGVLLQEYNEHDTWWHIALMKSLLNEVPPENPVYAGSKISGYHYFTDLVWVAFHQITGIPIEVIYIFISPIVISAMLAGSILLLSEEFSTDWLIRILISAVALWGSGFAFYAKFIFTNAKLVDSMFWLDQSAQYGINHQLMLAMAIGNILVWIVMGQKKVPWWFTGILLGSLAGIKIYAFLIYFPVFSLFVIYQFFKTKQKTLLFSQILSLLLAGTTIFFNQSNLGFPFIWLPGWFVKTMFESGNHLNFSTWEIHRQLFHQTHNLPRLIFHWFLGYMLFVIGNFGFKILSFIFLPLLFLKNPKKSLYYTKVLFLISISLLSISIPSLFIQKGVVWNTIQFMHFAQIPLSLLFFLLLRSFVAKQRYRKVILIFILILSLPTTVLTVIQNTNLARYNFHEPQFIEKIISVKDLPQSRIFLGKNLIDSSMVPALSGRAVQLADPTILEILGVSDNDRIITITLIESNKNQCESNEIIVNIINDETVFLQDCRSQEIQ